MRSLLRAATVAVTNKGFIVFILLECGVTFAGNFVATEEITRTPRWQWRIDVCQRNHCEIAAKLRLGRAAGLN